MIQIYNNFEDLEQDDLDELEHIYSQEAHASQDALPMMGQIRIAREQHSVFELLRQEKRNTLVLAPSFQRNIVWNDKHCSELIESILMGIPIPTIYLFENEFGIRQVVDGKQRISALKKFINNKFKLTNIKMLWHFEGLHFNDLKPFYQNIIEDFQINSYVIQPPTPENVKFTIFDRVNRGGIRLNKQEMRNGLYQGHSTILIKKIAESYLFTSSTGNSIDNSRMRDQYLVLRFFAFHLYFNNELHGFEYNSNMDEMLAYTMRYINLMDENKRALLEYTANKSLWNISNLLGDDAFRFSSKIKKRRPVNIGLFEILMNAFTSTSKTDDDKDIIKKYIDNVKIYIDNDGCCAKNINNIASLIDRYNCSIHIQKELNND